MRQIATLLASLALAASAMAQASMPILGKPSPALSAKVTAAIKEKLRDPYSAVFGEMRSIRQAQWPNDVTVCGTVNAKNGFGGYTGSSGFIYIEEQGRVKVGLQGDPFFDAVAPARCNPS